MEEMKYLQAPLKITLDNGELVIKVCHRPHRNGALMTSYCK
jgi:hypothetical protein